MQRLFSGHMSVVVIRSSEKCKTRIDAWLGMQALKSGGPECTTQLCDSEQVT